LYAIEEGVVETLIVWENFGINRYVFKNSVIKYLNHEQEADRNNFLDPATSSELEVQEVRSFIEWSRCELEFVNNQSLEGSQFCRGLGGIRAILRVQKHRSPGTAVEKIRIVSVKIVRMKDEEDGEDEPKLKAIYVFGK
jgi:peptide subunit release factor 1 (eRF1)